ncbi:heavy-metal-associated domain-containing protein [Halostella sp. JP-L12]|uniref:heavy-metal-associated domain-containing protein n=1 Tax=Halostella TaxID=1843185 RepID=UPI000EF7756A|nr:MULTISPECIES: heavy-metal-associated domain-containing protein [Halostella]NHN47945.1 heavy-metal-associated domain-containing protein [Halostella sp. JP-L12]
MAVSNAEFTVREIESSDDVQAIESELSELEGVMGTEIDAETGAAEIEFDHDIQSEERIEITVEELGYEVE